MYETLIEYHKILLKENLKAAPDKTYFMLKKVKFLGHIIEDKKVKPKTGTTNKHESLTKIPRNNKFPCEIRLWYATKITTMISYTKKTISNGQKNINKFLNK